MSERLTGGCQVPARATHMSGEEEWRRIRRRRMEKDKEDKELPRRIRSCSKTHHSSVYTLFLLLIAEIYRAVTDDTDLRSQVCVVRPAGVHF